MGVDLGCVKRFNEFFIGQYAYIVMHAFEGNCDARDKCVDMGLWDGRRNEAGDIIVIWMPLSHRGDMVRRCWKR